MQGSKQILQRNRRGVVLVLAAVMLALGALAFAMSIETSRRFLEWKVARSHAQSAALAAVAALDGTPEGLYKARLAAAAAVQQTIEQVTVETGSEGDSVRVRVSKNSVALAALAHQREVTEPGEASPLTLAALDTEVGSFGLKRGALYKAHGETGANLDQVVAIRVHSGSPKEIPLSWIAGRIRAKAAGVVEIEYLGGYLRGARHAAAKPNGYFEAALGAKAGEEIQ